jgi:hypothetical protein
LIKMNENLVILKRDTKNIFRKFSKMKRRISFLKRCIITIETQLNRFFFSSSFFDFFFEYFFIYLILFYHHHHHYYIYIFFFITFISFRNWYVFFRDVKSFRDQDNDWIDVKEFFFFLRVFLSVKYIVFLA